MSACIRIIAPGEQSPGGSAIAELLVASADIPAARAIAAVPITRASTRPPRARLFTVRLLSEWATPSSIINHLWRMRTNFLSGPVMRYRAQIGNFVSPVQAVGSK